MPSRRATLGSDTVVNILNGSGTLVEQMKFKTDCSQPVNLGDQFGGLTIFGMRMTAPSPLTGRRLRTYATSAAKSVSLRRL